MFCTSASTSRARRRAIIGAALGALVAGCATLPQAPLPPRVGLDAVRVTGLTASDTRLTLTLAVHNPNAYDLAVNSLDVDLALEGEPLLVGALGAPTVLAAGAVTPVEVDARTTFGAVASALEHLARRTTVRYEVQGTAVVQDGLRLPFARSGDLPAGRLLGGWR